MVINIKNMIFSDFLSFKEKIANINFENQNILIIETELTRIDSIYFTKAKSVKRVLCPLIITKEILKNIINFVETVNIQTLIIISLAKVSVTLAQELNNFGYVTISVIKTEVDISDAKNLPENIKTITEKNENDELNQTKYLSETEKLILP